MQFITQYILRVIIWNFTLLGRDGSLSQSRQHIGAFYEDLEVALNAGQVELLDLSKLRRELLTIVRRGASLDHMPGVRRSPVQRQARSKRVCWSALKTLLATSACA